MHKNLELGSMRLAKAHELLVLAMKSTGGEYPAIRARLDGIYDAIEMLRQAAESLESVACVLSEA